jgi:hypothetical protein
MNIDWLALSLAFNAVLVWFIVCMYYLLKHMDDHL